jgi:tetratricopeptide (TPR) repeat protein
MRADRLKICLLIAVLSMFALPQWSMEAYAQRGGRGIRVSSPGRRASKSQRAVADFQRDPIRLVKEFSLNKAKSSLPFDLALTVEQTLGAGAWETLNEKQRASVNAAFDETVKEVLKEWNPETDGHIRVLKSEIRGDKATITVLRELDLIRFSLRSRGRYWYITEHELVDDALPEFADAIQEALQPGTCRGQVYDMPADTALKYIEQLITTQGESAQLLLLKYRVLVSRQLPDDQGRAREMFKGVQPGRGQTNTPKPQQEPQLHDDKALEILERITQRWPDFAPGHLALAFDLLYLGMDDSIINAVSKDAERAITPLQRYIEIVPYDPRPWLDLAQAYELIEKPVEAEAAYLAAIDRDPTYLDHRALLVSFYLGYDQSGKAKASFAEMLKIAPKADDAFDGLYDEEGFDPDYAKELEDLLLEFQPKVESSRSGLVLLAHAREAQNKTVEAVKSMRRAVAIDARAEDIQYLSHLYRQLRRYTEALNGANQALKLDPQLAMAHFERACSLAQLGRKREALAALKLMMALDRDSLFDLNEPDLQPLLNMPEFRVLKEKMSERGGKNRDRK